MQVARTIAMPRLSKATEVVLCCTQLLPQSLLKGAKGVEGRHNLQQGKFQIDSRKKMTLNNH